MKGFKVYYDKDEKIFKYETEASEVETVSEDSTVSWSDTEEHAKETSKDLNADHLEEVQICKECGEPYWFIKEDRAWYEERGLYIPVRCCTCRKTRKAENMKKKKAKKQEAKERAKTALDVKISDIFIDCLQECVAYPISEVTKCFSQDKIKEHLEEINTIIDELPDAYKAKVGEYNMIVVPDSNDIPWVDHLLIEELYMLGVAAGKIKSLPYDFAKIIPGNLACYIVNK